MQNRLAVGLILSLGFTAWHTSQAVILPPPPPPNPPPKTVTLTWDYPDVEPGTITFNVYATTDITVPVSQWTILTNVAETSCSIPMDLDACFFFVTASNVVTGLESSYEPEPPPYEPEPDPDSDPEPDPDPEQDPESEPEPEPEPAPLPEMFVGDF